jgi:hypothetical protein
MRQVGLEGEKKTGENKKELRARARLVIRAPTHAPKSTQRACLLCSCCVTVTSRTVLSSSLFKLRSMKSANSHSVRPAASTSATPLATTRSANARSTRRGVPGVPGGGGGGEDDSGLLLLLLLLLWELLFGRLF